MPWITENEITRWYPDIIPEPTSEWNQQQMGKLYLKPDGSVVMHPLWCFNNDAYVDDEYIFHNEGWFTVIDDRPEDIDDQGNTYVIIELSSENWEKFDEYKVKKSYKKYLHIKKDKPEYKFATTVTHHYDFNDEDMTSTDVYVENMLTSKDREKLIYQLMSRIRNIRNYVLNKTDFYVLIKNEKNLSLSQDFINYRQILRDIPETIDLSSLSENDIEFINWIDVNSNLNIDQINISFFPQKPNNIFE